MSDPVCPHCTQAVPFATRLAHLAVCGGCGNLIVCNQDGTLRRAMASDTDPLAPRDRALLTKARSRLARTVHP